MNGYGSQRSLDRDHVDGDPDADDDRLAHQEPAGAEEAGDGLGEPAERVGVVVHPDAEPLPRGRDRSSRRRTIIGGRPGAASRREHVVEDVVDGDRADEPPGPVAHRHGQGVVGGEPLGDVAQGQVGLDRARARRRRSARGCVPGGSRSRRWNGTRPR